MANNNNSLRGTVESERRKRFLENLIKEAIINVLAEQQAPEAAPPPDAAAEPAPETAPAPDAPPEQDVNAAKPPAEFTVDDMIERLNTIRGGRSFTDPEVYGQLITWFKKLNDDQKAVLQNFLIEIGQVVVNLPSKQPGQEQASAGAPPAPPAAPAPPAPAAPAPEAPPVASVQTPGV